MNHIVIIGFMGSGKTRVGKAVAKRLGLPFLDVDKVIEKKMNMTVKELYLKFGEPYYRALETLAVKELAKDPDRKVLSLSAGLPVEEQNQAYIPKLGTIVYLSASWDTIKKRLENHPSMEQEDQEDKMKKLLKSRDQVYSKLADIKVVTGVVSFEELVQEIIEKLAKYLEKAQK